MIVPAVAALASPVSATAGMDADVIMDEVCLGRSLHALLAVDMAREVCAVSVPG